MNNKIMVVTNMYPTSSRPYFGTFVKNFYQQLESAGWECTLSSLTDFGEGVRAYLRWYYTCFISCLKFEGIVYVHYVSHSSIPVILAKLFNRKIKVVLNYHGSDAFPEIYESAAKKGFRYCICFIANKICYKIVCPTSTFANSVKHKFNVDKKFFVSPSGGVDQSVFFLDHEHSREAGTRVVTFAGRLIIGKGVENAMNIFKLLCNSERNTRFNIVGDGSLRNYVDDFVSNNMPKNTVTVYPGLSQMALADVLRNSDIFLFTSDRKGESLGLVWIEAIFSGCIPIFLGNNALKSELPDNVLNHIFGNSVEECCGLILNIFSGNNFAQIHDLLYNHCIKKYSKANVERGMNIFLNSLEGDV